MICSSVKVNSNENNVRVQESERGKEEWVRRRVDEKEKKNKINSGSAIKCKCFNA